MNDPFNILREFDGQIQRTQEELSHEALKQFLDSELDRNDEHNSYLDQFVYVVNGQFVIQIACPEGLREFRAPTRRELYDQLRSAL